MSLVVIVYWREVIAYFRGKPLAMKSSGLEARPTSPILSQFPTTKTQDSIQLPMPSNLEQQQTTATNPAIAALIARTQSPQRAAPRQYVTQQEVTQQVSPTPFQMPKNDQILTRNIRPPRPFPGQLPTVAVTNPPAPLGKPNTPGLRKLSPPVQRKLSPPVQPVYDKFKLPTKAPENMVDAHESTGSNYYKEITRGKKPVASISQYLLMKKHLGKKGKKTPHEPKKHHHHHHKNHHKNQKDGLENGKNYT